jgi:hypothetical protein
MSGGKTINTDAVRLGGLRIQNTGYGVAIPILYGTQRVSPVLIEYTNFIATPHTSTQSQGGKGGGFSQSSTTYTYTATVCMALCEGPVQAFGQLWIDKNTYTAPSSRGLALFSGTYPQAPWSYMSTYFPARAVGYQGVAYAAAGNYDLGSNASLGNHSFELTGVGTLRNGADVNVVDVITDFLGNANYGVNFPFVAGATQAWNYAQANGLFVSPLLNQQKPAADWLKQFAMIANIGLVWSGGQLKLLPYGDTAVTGNGATYTPNITPVYNLGDDDFEDDGSDPVKVARTKQADAFNAVRVEYLNRGNQYNIEPADVQDQANAEAYGLRTMSAITLHEVCVPAVAKLVAQTVLQRALYVRNTYTFKLSWKYCLLEPMDIVQISDSGLGLLNVPVRITTIEETYDGLLTITAEEMPLGVSQPVQYPQPGASSYQPNFNAAPPNSNAPMIFAPPIELATSTLELWLAACGPMGWGGCNVWASSDGSTYKQVGTMHGNSRMGVLSGALAAGSDPDLANTAHVDLSMSLGQMFSGTQNDADLLHTLCYVDGEFIAYENATLTSANHYDLSYLRRGAYNSLVTSHAAGTNFVRLDDAIFKLPYTPEQIGTTLYIKLQAFNQYQGGFQDLASLTPAAIVIPAPPAPENVANFAAQQSGNVVVFTWAPVIDYALKGYDIGYAHQGETNWNNFVLLTETARGTEMTNAAVPPGTWVFGIRAKDVIGQLSPQISTFNLIVTNSSPMVANVQQDPGWAGALSNLVYHVTGVLVPKGTKTCDQYAQLAAPASAPTLSTVAGGTLALRTYFVKASYKTATGETLASAEAIFSVAAGSLLVVASPALVAGVTGWDCYVGTASNAETEQNVSQIPIGTSWQEPSAGLIAGAALPVVNSTGWDVFNLFVPDPVPTCSYTTPTIDTGYNSTLRVYSTTVVALGYAQAGAVSAALSLDSWLTGGGDPNVYTPWTVGQVTLRYMNQRLTLSGIVAGAVPVISSFSAFADTTPVIENIASVTVAPGGSAVLFPQPYHTPPFVLPSAIGSTALVANASNITATGCTLHIFNSSGTDVGGTATYTATGA